MAHPCVRVIYRSRVWASTTQTRMIKSSKENEGAQGKDAVAHRYDHLVYNIALFSPLQISHQNTALGIYIFNKKSQNKSHHCTWAHLGLCTFCQLPYSKSESMKAWSQGGRLTASTLGQGLHLCDLTLLFPTNLIVF